VYNHIKSMCWISWGCVGFVGVWWEFDGICWEFGGNLWKVSRCSCGTYLGGRHFWACKEIH
jgi:hypothetical protein